VVCVPPSGRPPADLGWGMATQGLLRSRVGAVDADAAVQLGVRAPIAAASSGPGMGRDHAGPPPAAADTVAKDGLDCGVLLRRRAGTGSPAVPSTLRLLHLYLGF